MLPNPVLINITNIHKESGVIDKTNRVDAKSGQEGTTRNVADNREILGRIDGIIRITT